jgi:hemolysin activation/secretion protein
MIRAFQVVGNHWLASGKVEDLVYPFMGPDRTSDDVEKARGALQAEFEKEGFATVSVIIPEQGVDTGIIRLEVQPQAIGNVTVSGAKKPDKVLADAPSLKAGVVPNFHDVQHDIVGLNSVSNRKVTPEVKAGVAPGTVDVNLKVEDTSAFHASAEINNYKSPSTTDLRTSGTLRYDDLWGRGDSISVSGQTAPRRTSDGSVASANYLSHVGKVQLLAYFVHSNSDIAVVGGTDVVGKGNLAGFRAIVPLSQSDGFYQSLTVGIDYKDFEENVLLGADRSTAPIEYFPITAGWRGDWTQDKAKSFLALNAIFGVRGLGDGLLSFDTKRFDAKPDFFYLKGEAATTVDIWKNFQIYAHLSGQYSDSPLVSNEEFSVGGADTVRGYDESETLGDYGYAYQFEVRSPKLFEKLTDVDELRVLGFIDSGYWGIHKVLAGQDASGWLASAGGGVRLKIFKIWNGSLDVGVPLRTGPDTKSGQVFTRFRIWGEF